MKQMNVLPILTIAVALLAIVAVSGCTTTGPSATATPAPTATPVPAVTALSIIGNVSNSMNLTMADLVKYPNMTTTTKGKNNTTITGTGASLNKLLDDAKPLANASVVTFTGSDGYSASINMTDIRAANGSIISYESDGTLKNIVPGQKPKLFVGNLTTIKVS